MNKQGKAKAAYDKAYNDRPEQVKNRMQRNRARAQYEREHGDLPSDVDVDHKRPIKSGGSNSPSNLRAVHKSKNRSKGNN